MVKVGDTVVSVSDETIDIKIGNKYVVTGVAGFTIQFLDDGNSPITRNIRDYRTVKTSQPPQKIQQDGYEYELVGPVKPDWLVDGAWVVRKGNGETHQINQVSSDCFSATSESSRVTGLTAQRIADEFRPHTPEDFKWGDWAMYDGKRVFVMGKIKGNGLILVSYKDFDFGFIYVHPSSLTPTF